MCSVSGHPGTLYFRGGCKHHLSRPSERLSNNAMVTAKTQVEKPTNTHYIGLTVDSMF